MSARILVDTSVLLDVLTEDPVWYPWSAATLAECAETSTLAVNPVIYAEVSAGFDRIEDVEEALPSVSSSRWGRALAAPRLLHRRPRLSRTDGACDAGSGIGLLVVTSIASPPLPPQEPLVRERPSTYGQARRAPRRPSTMTTASSMAPISTAVAAPKRSRSRSLLMVRICSHLTNDGARRPFFWVGVNGM